MKTNFITSILIIATPNNSQLTSHKVCEQIANYVGRLNCKISDKIAMVHYDGILSSENKDKLQNVAKSNAFVLLFLETECETKWITDKTIHIPSTNEMKEHLN